MEPKPLDFQNINQCDAYATYSDGDQYKETSACDMDHTPVSVLDSSGSEFDMNDIDAMADKCFHLLLDHGFEGVRECLNSIDKQILPYVLQLLNDKVEGFGAAEADAEKAKLDAQRKLDCVELKNKLARVAGDPKSDFKAVGIAARKFAQRCDGGIGSPFGYVEVEYVKPEQFNPSNK